MTRVPKHAPFTIAMLGLFVLLAADPLSAAHRVPIQPPEAPNETPTAAELADPSSTIKVDVPLVVLSVTVTDEMNRIITGLRKRNFQVKEDKISQDITQFGAEDTPLSVGLVFDASESMGQKLIKAREAVAEFLRTSERKDEFFLVRVGHRPEMLMDFTSDRAEIQNKLIFTESKGRTALLDSLYLAVSHMRGASNPRKAILIISDGADNNSRYSQREIRRLVKEADVQIYTIGIFEPAGSRTLTPEELVGPTLLSRLAELTGGSHYPVEDVNDLPDVIENIGIALRNQYVLGYVPKNQTKDGKWRRLRVKVTPIPGLPWLHTHYRLGYYAPAR